MMILTKPILKQLKANHARQQEDDVSDEYDACR